MVNSIAFSLKLERDRETKWSSNLKIVGESEVRKRQNTWDDPLTGYQLN